MVKALQLQNLTKTYSSKIQALKGINLEVAEGDFFALLGPNGAGKSTAIGIISSLVNKTSGKVSILGYDLDKQRTQAKSCIGLVPQEFNFNQFESVIDIVVNQAGFYGIDRKTALMRAEQYLSQLGLWEKRHAVSRTLSGGMKRRLMIVRALIHQPRMLILDEPTAGVDIELRRSMWEFLKLINEQGTTIILTTHYLEEAENLCRGIAIIDKGEIIEHTTIKEIINRLTTQTLVLDLKKPLNVLPEIKDSVLKKIDEQTLEITLPKTKSLNSLFNEFSEHKIEISSLRNKTNRLEELFIDLIQRNPGKSKLS